MTKIYKMNIFLIPVDFSANSLVALEQATLLSRLDRGSLHLLHVIEPVGFNTALKNLLFNQEDQVEAFKKEALMKLEELASDIRQTSALDVICSIEVAKPYRAIIDTAKKIKASYIVMGTNGIDETKDIFVGTNTSRVISESPCPVLSIRKKPKRKGFKNIILPLDLTTDTTQKVKSVINSGKFFGATIHVISVLMTDEMRIKALLRKQLNEVEDEILAAGVSCVAKLIEGKDIVESIFEYAYDEEVKADLIMIMTRQENDFSSMILGTQAARIVNNSKIPVFSITPKK